LMRSFNDISFMVLPSTNKVLTAAQNGTHPFANVHQGFGVRSAHPGTDPVNMTIEQICATG
jgi:hypothetical protein